MSTFEPGAIRSARVVSEISVVWTVCTSTLAIALGIAAGSIVLIAFGAVGYVDAIGSVALVHHFRHGLANDALDDRFERRAHRIVTIGLIAVGTATIITSVARLIQGGSPESSWAGAVTAGASLIVLTVLSRRKQVLGRADPERGTGLRRSSLRGRRDGSRGRAGRDRGVSRRSDGSGPTRSPRSSSAARQ